MAYVIIAEARVYKGVCKEYRGLPTIDKAWPNFKRYFFQTFQDTKQ